MPLITQGASYPSIAIPTTVLVIDVLDQDLERRTTIPGLDHAKLIVESAARQLGTLEQLGKRVVLAQAVD